MPYECFRKNLNPSNHPVPQQPQQEELQQNPSLSQGSNHLAKQIYFRTVFAVKVCRKNFTQDLKNMTVPASIKFFHLVISLYGWSLVFLIAYS